MTNRLARYWWYTVMAVSAAAAAILSFTAWRDLALYTGGSPTTAWVLPIAVDVLAAGALTAYVLWGDRFAHLVAVFVVAVSATGNALSHLYRVQVSGIETVAATWVVTAVWTLPPLVLYVNSQLYARKLRKDTPDGAVALADTAGDAGVPVPVLRGDHRTDADEGVAPVGDTGRPPARKAVARPRAKGGTRTPARSREQLARTIVDQGWGELSGDKLARLLHVAKGPALAARGLARESTIAESNGAVTLVK